MWPWIPQGAHSGTQLAAGLCPRLIPSHRVKALLDPHLSLLDAPGPFLLRSQPGHWSTSQLLLLSCLDNRLTEIPAIRWGQPFSTATATIEGTVAPVELCSAQPAQPDMAPINLSSQSILPFVARVTFLRWKPTTLLPAYRNPLGVHTALTMKPTLCSKDSRPWPACSASSLTIPPTLLKEADFPAPPNPPPCQEHSSPPLQLTDSSSAFGLPIASSRKPALPCPSPTLGWWPLFFAPTGSIIIEN